MIKSQQNIVIIHRGNSRWLSRTLRSACVSNPSARIVLIGDHESACVAQSLEVEFVEWDRYAREADALDKVYCHRSTHGREFELTCLQRWLVLESWMVETGINDVVAIDSDILVFSELKQVLRDVECNGVGCVHDSAHLAWIRSVDHLSAICDFVRMAYADTDHKLINEIHRDHLTHTDQGGVSDMSFFCWLMRDGSGRVSDIRGPHGKRKWCFDVTINDGIGGFELAHGLKKIEWHDHIPHAYHTSTREWLPFATLHFQGQAKQWMPEYFEKVHAFRHAEIQKNDRRIVLGRVKRKIRRLILRD